MNDTVVRRRLNWPMALMLLVILAGVWWFVSIALVMYFGGLLAFCGGAAGGVVVAWVAAWFFDPWIWVVEPVNEARHRARRGDDVDRFLTAARDAYPRADERHRALDLVLDTYRLHADVGAWLHEHACDGPACCHDVARAGVSTP